MPSIISEWYKGQGGGEDEAQPLPNTNSAQTQKGWEETIVQPPKKQKKKEKKR